MAKPFITVSLDWITEHLGDIAYTPHPEIGVGGLWLPQTRGHARYEGDTCIVLSTGCRLDLTGRIDLGLWCMIGAGAMLLTHEHDHSGPEPLVFREEREDNFTRALDKKIGKDVWIYASRILAGCTAIANGVVVAAGSVVTRPIEEPYTIWAGVPARKIGKR